MAQNYNFLTSDPDVNSPYGDHTDLIALYTSILTNNSGAAAPSTTHPFMWWADTTNDLLKIRDAGNSAWVTVGTLSAIGFGLGILTAEFKTGNYIVTTNDANKMFIIGGGGAALTMTLPAASAVGQGFRVVFAKNESAYAHAINVAGTDTIDGGAVGVGDSLSKINETVEYVRVSSTGWRRLTHSTLADYVDAKKTRQVEVGYDVPDTNLGNASGLSGGTLTPDISQPWIQRLHMDADFTLAVPAPVGYGGCVIHVQQDAIGGRSLTVDAGYVILGAANMNVAANAHNALHITRAVAPQTGAVTQYLTILPEAVA